MLFGCAFCQGLEPVGHVGDVILKRPLLHSKGHAVGRLAVERLAFVNAVQQILESGGVKILFHLGPVKDKFPEIVGRERIGALGGDGLLLKTFFYQVESVHTNTPPRS